MIERTPQTVIGRGGLRGQIVGYEELPSPPGRVVIRFDDGRHLFVPPELLTRRDDGTYDLPLGPDELPTTTVVEEQRIPLAEETLHVGKRAVETRGRVNIKVHEREETIDLPLLNEAVTVERVAVHRVVDSPPPVREEGDAIVIPLLEEVVSVEKKLMLREEVWVSRQRSETHQPQRVTLRREEAEVERVEQPEQSATEPRDAPE